MDLVEGREKGYCSYLCGWLARRQSHTNKSIFSPYVILASLTSIERETLASKYAVAIRLSIPLLSYVHAGQVISCQSTLSVTTFFLKGPSNLVGGKRDCIKGCLERKSSHRCVLTIRALIVQRSHALVTDTESGVSLLKEIHWMQKYHQALETCKIRHEF